MICRAIRSKFPLLKDVRQAFSNPPNWKLFANLKLAISHQRRRGVVFAGKSFSSGKFEAGKSFKFENFEAIAYSRLCAS
jgi:hypothetical protein